MLQEFRHADLHTTSTTVGNRLVPLGSNLTGLMPQKTQLP